MTCDEDCARLRRKVEGKRGQNHDTGDSLGQDEGQAGAKGRSQQRESTQPFPDLEGDIGYAAVGGSAPMVGRSSSSASVLVNSSMTASVEDMVQTDVPLQPNVGIPSSITRTVSSGTVGSLCFNESKAGDFGKLTNLVLAPNTFLGRAGAESVQGLAKICLEMCAVDLAEVYSPALFNKRSRPSGLSTGVPADLTTGWNLETKARRHRCSNDLRSARPNVLASSSPSPLCETPQ